MALQMAEDKFDKSYPHPLHLCNQNHFVLYHILYHISQNNRMDEYFLIGCIRTYL